MHDHLFNSIHMLTKHWARDLVHSTMRMCRWKRHKLWTCTNYCRGHTPHSKQQLALAPTKCAMAIFSLYSNVATGLLTGMTKNRSHLLLRSRLGGYSVSAGLAGLSKCTALSHRSFDNVLPEAFRPLLTVHMALQFWPILSLIVRTFSPPVLHVHSNRAYSRRVSLPSCNDTDYIRKMIIWKIFSLHTIIIKGWSRDGRAKKNTNELYRDNCIYYTYIPTLAFWVGAGN